jgi:capsular polysaccharide biosynthesis protein
MGGCSVVHSATRGYLLKDVWLIDGTLYKDNAHSWLLPRSRWWPHVKVECEIDRGAIFCSMRGNQYFGQWLMDDCVTYPLASAEGVPVTTAQPVNIHTTGYEDMLGMKPIRLQNAFFRELVIFEDNSMGIYDSYENRHKHLRFRAMSDRLLSKVKASPHPGVFILRGKTGELRFLKNEIALAEHLRDRRGFQILDPSEADVPTIVATCAGARTVVGVEGSQLIHGMLTLQPGGSLLTLQPPNRFVSMFKHMTDRDQQNFGFVVGHLEGKGFHNNDPVERVRTTPWTGVGEVNGYYIDPEEVERTLDLFPD